MLLVLVFAMALVYRNTLDVSQRSFLYFVLCFTLLLFAILGLTTPVTGAMVRYKIPALPFLCTGILMLLNQQKLPTIIQNNKFSTWIKSHL
jgi:hypothetical protein